MTIHLTPAERAALAEAAQAVVERAVLALLAERDQLAKNFDSSERAYWRVIHQRDARGDQLVEAARALGCDEEWTNQHDHGICIQGLIADLKVERDQLAARLAELAAAEKERDAARECLRELRDEWWPETLLVNSGLVDRVREALGELT